MRGGGLSGIAITYRHQRLEDWKKDGKKPGLSSTWAAISCRTHLPQQKTSIDQLDSCHYHPATSDYKIGPSIPASFWAAGDQVILQPFDRKISISPPHLPRRIRVRIVRVRTSTILSSAVHVFLYFFGSLCSCVGQNLLPGITRKV